MSTYTERSVYELSSFNTGQQLKGTDTSYWISIDVNSTETDTDQGAKFSLDGKEGDRLMFMGAVLPTTETIQITVKGGQFYSAGYQGTDSGDVAITVRSGAVKAPLIPTAFTPGTDTDNGEFFLAGPIETSRFKDSDGYVKVLGGGTGCSATDLDVNIGAVIIG